MSDLSACRIVFNARFRWWLMPYLHTLRLFCVTFDREPNWERVRYWIERAIVIRLAR